MSLFLASILGFAQIQTFGFDVRDLFESKAPIQIQEIKEGQCLGATEIEAFAGVENVDLYYTYECGKPYETIGTNLQQFACGLDGISGQWKRSIQEHGRPGFFWPDAVPCMSSVTSLDYSNAKFTEMTEESFCDVDHVQKVSDRTEIMRTQKFDIGQGEGFLPHPLAIQVLEYDRLSDGTLQTKSCKQSEFNAEYKGWGVFQLQWKRMDCVAHKETECFVAKIEQSKNSEGNPCALIKKLTKCPLHP